VPHLLKVVDVRSMGTKEAQAQTPDAQAEYNKL